MKRFEFSIGEVVTYCHGSFMMRGVVLNRYIERGDPRYLLMQEPEGKPISQHNQVDAHPAYIMQSKHFKGVKNTRFHFDKEKNQLTQLR